jgi:hypothetical protein
VPTRRTSSSVTARATSARNSICSGVDPFMYR